ncbi:MAG: carboxypeptidase regulatory-like domain-containing protein [Hamadaea sp.]|nr:carboxypeptidase regulatory-like domain-containing protein [Hamadaea sp.]
MSRSLLRRIGLIATVVALGGVGLTPAAQAATPGTIAGTLTDNGVPVADAWVYAYADSGDDFGAIMTSSTGHYTISGLEPGSYRVTFHPPDRPIQHAYSKIDESLADVITVTSGATTTVNDDLIDTGMISGTLVDSQGAPVADAHVSASSPAGGYGFATTAADGSYAIRVFPGSYTVSFHVGSVEQFAHGKTYEDADVFAVTANATTTVDETLLPTGTVTGRVTFSNGLPVGDVEVEAVSPDGGSGPHVQTAEDGTYTLSYLEAGSYKLAFRLPSGALQYAHDSRNLATAQVVTVAAAATVTVDESLLPTGRIAGKLTTASGAALANASVQIHGIEGEWISATTDAAGNYAVDQLFVASGYKVFFSDWDIHLNQWAYGKLSAATANTFAVTAGATTTVNDKQLATGSVKVTAKDSVTGAAIGSFYASIRDDLSGSTTTGSLTVGSVPVGTHTIEAWSQGYNWGSASVTVTAGQTASATVTLVPKAKVKVKVIDRITGAPLAGVIVLPMKSTRFAMPDGIGERTAADGTLTVEMGTPGVYQLFAFPKTGSGYGAQWVGATGGTGFQTKARSFLIANGQTVDGVVIKMDKAGTITGKVTSATGAPIKYGTATMAPQAYHSGGGFGEVGIAADGSYTINFLGPYTWPLLLSAQNHAMQWSDGTGYRYHAPTALPRRSPGTAGAAGGTTVSPSPWTPEGPGTGTTLPRRTTSTAAAPTGVSGTTDLPTRGQPTTGLYGVTVTSGQTVTFNYTMKAGIAVKTVVPGLADDGFVDVYNASTGDFLGTAWADDLSAGTSNLLLPGTKVKFLALGGDWQWCGGTTFGKATVYTVTTSPTQTFTCSVS